MLEIKGSRLICQSWIIFLVAWFLLAAHNFDLEEAIILIWWEYLTLCCRIVHFRESEVVTIKSREGPLMLLSLVKLCYTSLLRRDIARLAMPPNPWKLWWRILWKIRIRVVDIVGLLLKNLLKVTIGDLLSKSNQASSIAICYWWSFLIGLS